MPSSDAIASCSKSYFNELTAAATERFKTARFSLKISTDDNDLKILTMKILALCDTPDRPEMALLQGLITRGHQVSALISSGAEQVAFTQRISFRFSSRMQPSAIRLLRTLCSQYDLIHCFSARALSNTLLATWCEGSSVAITAYRGTVGHLSGWDPTSWLSFRNPRVNAISCVSNAVLEYLHPRVGHKTLVERIYKGHEPYWYDQVVATPRSEFGIPDGAPTVCFVGNMRAVKGADILVEAFSSLRHPTAHLLLVGEVRDAAVTKAVARSLVADRIHLLGRRNDAGSIIKACDLFVMPSREREGLPKAVIEAMLLQKPVVVTDAGGMPEMIRDGLDGMIVQRGNTKALAQAIQSMLAAPDRQCKMGESARARATELFAVAPMVEATEKLFERALLRRY